MKKRMCTLLHLFTRRKTFVLLTLCIFSACAFSSDSFAYSGFTAPNSTNKVKFTSEIYPGCIIDTYNIGFASNPREIVLGANKITDLTTGSSDLHNCGYRWNINNNNHMNYYSYNPIKRQNVIYDGSTLLSDSLDSAQSFNYNDGFASAPFDIYNQLNTFSVQYETRVNNAPSSFTIPTSNSELEGDNYWPWATFLVRFDMPDSASYSGLNVVLDQSSLNVSNSSMSLEVASNYINDSIIQGCGGFPDSLSDRLYSIFNISELSAPDGYKPCFIVGSIPMSLSGSIGFNNRTLKFVPADASRYENYTTASGVRLNSYGYPWESFFRSPSYKSLGAKDDYSSLQYINPSFSIMWPETNEESQISNQLELDLSKYNEVVSNGANIEQDNDYADNATISAWFDVFDIGNIFFPFVSFFQGFLNPVTTCAYIPDVAEWLHTSETTYCSWWPPTVINTLTPIFTIVPMMILFGFIVSWLRTDRAYSVFNSAERPGRH